MFASPMFIIILQYANVLNQHVIHLKLTQRYRSITSQLKNKALFSDNKYKIYYFRNQYCSLKVMSYVIKDDALKISLLVNSKILYLKKLEETLPKAKLLG